LMAVQIGGLMLSPLLHLAHMPVLLDLA